MNTDTYTKAWERVATEVDRGAWGIAWDGCHKTYIAMDQQQHEWFKDSGYEYLDVQSWDTDSVVNQLREWFEQSCFLRFINSVHTTSPNPNDGYTALISQFEYRMEHVTESLVEGLGRPTLLGANPRVIAQQAGERVPLLRRWPCHLGQTVGSRLTVGDLHQSSHTSQMAVTRWMF